MMLLLAAVTAAAAVMLMPGSVAMAAAEPTSPEGPTPAAEREAPVCTTSSAAAAVAEAARQVCGSAPIDEALLSVRLRPEAAEDVGRMLAGLGFRQALDLQLLAGGPEAAELLGELKAGGLPIGDRAKVRLLVRDRAVHLGRLVSSAGPPALAAARDDDADHHHDHHHQQPDEEMLLPPRRQLQKQDEAGGMSMDTIAIVLTVLVGAAGYLLQALTARRAERAAADQAQKLHVHETTREREHEYKRPAISHEAL